MSTPADIKLHSSLQVSQEGKASAELSSGAETALSGLILTAMKQVASDVAGQMSASTVSVSLDFTGEDFRGGAVDVECTVDRQTRTLIFMHAYVSTAGRHLLKATAIFRLS
ncbi:hypothetical protein [Henriciella pelagia]|uniref:Thioesterase domain-containing protein n=1 Tax=Henriciella pelagia TaxID=1977912 RepID=A0ABQ1JUX7_9PROT|nr:hypothetical protein [Henriciella pelagia]GGB78534.1 hypothetical protein GCM10011503_29200 [Henriciella pelagia]